MTLQENHNQRIREVTEYWEEKGISVDDVLPFSGNDAKELNKYYNFILIPESRRLVLELKNEYPDEWKKERRIEYVKENITALQEEIKGIERDYQAAINNDTPYLDRGIVYDNFKSIKNKLQGLRSHLKSLEGNYQNKITDDMIERARQYPISNMVQVKRGIAICPFHNDKQPSMSVSDKKNLYYCHACKAGGDSITFVMSKENMTFSDAVLYLCQKQG